jgi:cell division protein FtsW
MTAGTVARAAPRRKERLPELDWPLLSAAVALAVIGLVMVASASLHLGDRSGNPFHFVIRQGIALGIGGIAALFVSQIPLKDWQEGSTRLYFVGLALVAIVLLPGVGHEANGAVRWIRVGPLSVQTSEFMKLFMVVYLAGYLERREHEVRRDFWAFVRPMILLVIACAMIMLQPDFGTTFVLLSTALGMMFLGGAPLWQFGSLIGLAGVALAGLVVTSPYRLARVTAFLDPWGDPQGAGYQLSQALIAFGRGEWAGVGLGNGIQKQFYLPEAHTDFIMAVIGEEFGLVGTLAVVGLFAVIFWRAFANGALAERSGNRFAAFLSYGCGLWIGLQACINVGVNVGRLPTKGLTLPLVSYGSNSVIVTCMAIAVLLRVHHEVRQAAPTRRGARRWSGA